ncbi:MAG: hypothetical protein AAGF12_29035 [Myxococcota bacterium]
MADDPKKTTARGHPGPPETQAVDDKTAVSLPPFVEVELVYERGYVGMPTEDWKAFEVWTRNRIYVTDWNMRCVEVLDRKTGRSDRTHSLLGAYLAGGQRQDEDYMEMTFPCPRPGTEAVFEYRGVRKGFVNTSTVTRVVLRLRVLTVPRERAVPVWDELTSSHRLPSKPGQ